MSPEKGRPPGGPGAEGEPVGTDIVAPEHNTVMTEAEARQLTSQIRAGVEDTWALIVEAFDRRAWVALGYESFSNYLDAEIGNHARLKTEDRRDVVEALRASGLSTRAIAAATGAARNTVVNDLAEVAQIEPPEERRRYRVEVESRPDRVVRANTELEVETPEATAPRRPERIKGLDGKAYTPKVPGKPRRGPLMEYFVLSAHKVVRGAEALIRWTEDDRFPPNREKINGRWRGDLERARNDIDEVLGRLDGGDQR